jgi:lysophospholipase L1-like esterase
MNTNPNAKRILCFGDSNVWGYISGSDHERQEADKRWPGILQNMLGSNYEIIEEGLNSRAINNEDRRLGKEGRNAMDYILPCLDSHDPLDWVVVMLGSNEFKHEYNMTPENINQSMEELLTKIINRKSQFRSVQPKIILISPPLINEDTEYCKNGNKYLGATGKSKVTTSLFKKLSEELKINFLDSTSLTETGVDGVHITGESHAKLGEAISKIINA